MAVSIGIEIGPEAIRATRLERAGGAFRLLTVEEQPYDPSQADALGRALAQLRRSLRIAQPVIVGLPDLSAILATVYPLVVNRSRAELAVEFELQQQLPFELSQTAWHYQWLSLANGGRPEGSRLKALGSRQEPPSLQPTAYSLEHSSIAVAAVMKQPLLEERLAICRRAGLDVAGVSIAALGLLNACSLQRSLARAKAFAILHRLDASTAEWILWAPQRLQVVPVQSASSQTLPEELAASWQGLKAQWPEAAPMICTVNMDASVSERLSRLADVRLERFDPAQAVAMRAVRPELAQRAAASIGLALQGLGAARVPLNLLDHVQRAQGARWVRRVALGMAAVCAAAIVTLSLSGMAEIRQQRLRLLRALEQRERTYQRLRPEIRAMLQQQQRTEQLTAQLQGLVSASPALTATLAAIAQALPKSLWLTKVECAKSLAALDVTLEGRAASFQDVTQLLDRLKNLSGVTAVKPLSTNVVPAPAPPESAPAAGELVAFAIQLQRALP
ncbi:MAG: PilN domain-containing protein [Candidatus Omnitrophica bacterium]|nr:PilN domain-containing protein [Candidatus Omnitrophota bacterium]